MYFATANLGATSFNADGYVAHHKADGRLVWAAAKELPESLFSVGGETTLTCQKLLRAREVVENDVQRQAREATRGSVGAGAMARSLPKPAIKNLRQGKILGADEKYPAGGGVRDRKFDHNVPIVIPACAGPFLPPALNRAKAQNACVLRPPERGGAGCQFLIKTPMTGAPPSTAGLRLHMWYIQRG